MRSALVEVWADGDTGHGWDGYVVRYEVGNRIPEHDGKTAMAFVESTLEPASEDAILAELGRLRVKTISRDVGLDLTLVFSAYADELARYPADVVRTVLRGWRGKFWPAWAELAEQLDRITKPRHALRETLRRAYRGPEREPERAPLTDAERQEIDDMLKRHGIRLDDRGRVRPIEDRAPLRKIDPARDERVLPEIRDRWIAALLADQPQQAAE